MRKIYNFLKNYFVAHKVISTIGVIVVVFLGFKIFGSKTASYQIIDVTRGTVTQEVEVTGRVVSASDLSLAFEKAGKVVQVRKQVGDRVGAYEPIVILDQSDLLAQLAQAKASAAAEKASLDELVVGTRVEELNIKETAVLKAKQTLTNAYNNAPAVMESAYITSNDAIRKQISDLFIQAETVSPQLSYATNNRQAQNDAQTKRFISGVEIDNWRYEISALYGASASSTPSDLDLAIKKSQAHLDIFRDLLISLNDTLANNSNLSATAAAAYRAEITTAGTQIATAVTDISNLDQGIKDDLLGLQSAENDLALAKAGSTKEQIDAQGARYDAASANVASVGAQLEKTIIRAPIRGIITRQDAKVGQIVSPNVGLVGLIAEGAYEIDANVPEVDIGKMAIGNEVNIIFDALQGETFKGKVFSIDPAETVIDGAVNFKIKVGLDATDPRIRSGFTANLSIATQKKEGVLTLPQFAIIQNDQGIFVKKQEGGTFKDFPITLGIRSKDGMVEIVSGVSEGEKVANIGLKSAGQ